MIYRIYPQDAETLLEKPETGMGYQIINASQYNRTLIKKFVVYNSNLAVELDSDFQINKRLIINEGYKAVLNKATELMLETDSIKVLERTSIREYRVLSETKKQIKKDIQMAKVRQIILKKMQMALMFMLEFQLMKMTRELIFKK
jgi:hypothetical protein